MSDTAATTTTADTSAATTQAAPASLSQLGNPQQQAPANATITQPQIAQSFGDLLDDKGSFKPDWTKSLPEHLRPFEGTLGKYPTPFDALGALGNAQKLISSRESVKLPGADATPEQWAAYRGAVAKLTGAPDKVDDYGLKAPETLPEGMEWDGEFAGKAAAIAHKYGLPKEALHELAALNNEKVAGLIAGSKDAQAAETQALIDKLNGEWGKDAPTNWQQAKRAIHLLGGDPKKDSYTNEDVIRMALTADRMFREDNGLINGDANNATSTISERIAKLQADPVYQSPKNDTEMKRQIEIQSELFRLREMLANGGK